MILFSLFLFGKTVPHTDLVVRIHILRLQCRITRKIDLPVGNFIIRSRLKIVQINDSIEIPDLGPILRAGFLESKRKNGSPFSSPAGFCRLDLIF